MKKIVAWMCIGLLAVTMAGCGEQKTQDSVGNVPESQEEPNISGTPQGETQDEGDAQEYGDWQGWSSGMQAVKSAVVGELGDDYFPDAQMDPEIFENMIGISPDLYDDYFAEMPMISTNVDSLIIVKAKEGQADAVEEALKGYRDGNINNTMQYPMNVGKVQASKVDRSGNYVIFAQLGGSVDELMEEGDEAVIKHCQETNDKVIALIKDTLGIE